MSEQTAKPGWHKQDIIAAVRKRGTTLMRLSVENGLNRNTLNLACEARFSRAHTIIAEFLGVPRHEIWPQFYDDTDTPTTLRRLGPASGRAA